MEEQGTALTPGIWLAVGTAMPVPLFWYLLEFYRPAFFPGVAEVPLQITQILDFLTAILWPLLVFHAGFQFLWLRNGRYRVAQVAAYAVNLAVPLAIMGTIGYHHLAFGA